MGQTTNCGSADSNKVLSPTNPDTDGDGLWDGQEIGLTSPGRDTSTTVFHADTDPTTTTSPLVKDATQAGAASRGRDSRRRSNPRPAGAPGFCPISG